MNTTIKKTFWFWIPAFAGMTWLLALPALAIVISPAIPGMTTAVTSNTSSGAFVSGFYNFALMIGGVLAFGAIVYGGILYAASAGNPSKQSEGKEWVKSALLGLLLLAGSYLILYTINPNLVNLNLPTLEAINIAAPPATCTNVCPTGSSPINAPSRPGGALDCTCTNASGDVFCGGVHNARCPNDANGNAQTCTNQGSTVAPNWQCIKTSPGTPTTYKCGDSSHNIVNCPIGVGCWYQNGEYRCAPH